MNCACFVSHCTTWSHEHIYSRREALCRGFFYDGLTKHDRLIRYWYITHCWYRVTWPAEPSHWRTRMIISSARMERIKKEKPIQTRNKNISLRLIRFRHWLNLLLCNRCDVKIGESFIKLFDSCYVQVCVRDTGRVALPRVRERLPTPTHINTLFNKWSFSDQWHKVDSHWL